MSGSPLVHVGSAALAVAYKAKVADVDQMDVDGLVTMVQQFLDPDHALSRACIDFATAYEMAWREPDQVIELGERLQQAVLVAVRPDPPDMGRADIYG